MLEVPCSWNSIALNSQTQCRLPHASPQPDGLSEFIQSEPHPGEYRVKREGTMWRATPPESPKDRFLRAFIIPDSESARGAHIKNSYRLFQKKRRSSLATKIWELVVPIIQLLQPMCPGFWTMLKAVAVCSIPRHLYRVYQVLYITCARFHSTTSGVWWIVLKPSLGAVQP